MNELTIVNGMLSLIGELPVESLYEDHGYVPTARDILDEADKDIQSRGWWFNVERTTLEPDPNGEIVLGGDIISFSPYMSTEPSRFVQRGTRVYDTFNAIAIRISKGTTVQRISTVVLSWNLAATWPVERRWTIIDQNMAPNTMMPITTQIQKMVMCRSNTA